MATPTPAALTLTADQKECLLTSKIDITNLILINNLNVDPSLPVDAYSTGHYLLFFDGTPENHVAFFKKMYSTATNPELELKAHGIYAYQAASAKFNTPENKVTVS